MKRLVLLGACSAAVTSAMLVCAGPAAADEDVVGQKFSDAKATLSQAGKTVQVSSKVGDRKTQDNCIVTNVTNSTGLNGYGGKKNPIVMVNLNCQPDKVQAEQ